jgi:alpha-L-fucosidase
VSPFLHSRLPRTIIALSAIIVAATIAIAQPTAETETDPAVLKKLAWFQDQKFGFMMHWGPYSQWGVVESWSLCSEDEPWCTRRMDNYVDYCKAYEELPRTFNPLGFDPEAWAAAAQYAGMRYVVFTTKHHDGFCMFDTKQTDYRITGPQVPFRTNPRANVAHEIFDAFRKKGLGIGAYFSKPDWHSPYYWAPNWAHADRNVNYDIAKHPDIWKSFVDFTYKQIEELMTGYGPIDILWLDGGWVNTGNRRQDINMPAIAAMGRTHNPGLIVVDRAVPGRYENYRTPEQEVPERPLPYPWETCMTMGNSWSYVPNDHYKSTHRLIHLLVDIVAKGGNFLLNVGPDPSGTLPPEALQRMNDIGNWMTVNGKAIYATRPVAPYKEGKICYTRSAGGAVNAIYLADESEKVLPSAIWLQSISAKSGSTIRMMGVQQPLTWEKNGRGVLVHIPPAVAQKPPCEHAWSIVVEQPGI